MRFVTPTRRSWTEINYITRGKRGSQAVGDRENQHPAEGVSGPRLSSCSGEKMLEWGPYAREAGLPRPRLSNPGERERNAVMAIRVGSICCSSVPSPTHLSHSKTFSNPFEPIQKSERCIFLKNCVTRLYCVVVMILHASAYEYTTLLLNWIIWNRTALTFNCVNKFYTYTKLNCLN